MLDKILFVANYPNPVSENLYVFFRNLIYAMADLGVECHVISPVSVTKYKNKVKKIPQKAIEKTKSGKEINVYYPRFVSLSSKKFGPINTAHYTYNNYARAVLKTVDSIGVKFDAVYGHFFLNGGLSAARVGRKLGIPAFVAYGESSYKTQVRDPYGVIKDADLKGISGIISVSSKNTQELKDEGIFDNIPVFTCPNAVDMSLFNNCNKAHAREKFNIPQDKFIVGFVGGFIDRKGDKRLLKACEPLEDVYLAFAGAGENPPTGEKVVFCDSVNHDYIGDFLSALDVFVLPTLNEGCCNAVLEAMAAGLPIVSSDLSFNDGVLDNNNSIRINPSDVDAIKEAIRRLRDDEQLRTAIANAAYESAQNFTIEKRAEKIYNFIESFID